MKTWNRPVLEELALNQTAGGGPRSQKMDHVYLSEEEIEFLRKHGHDVSGDWTGFQKVSGQ
ncbi:hypothetical protein [Butyrivibrio sp. VCB2006]|uniref:hypothetical protein n=1 Tax=Butyrivibrio sp. VCB2006 TaxID=1280679 RepID=UPI00040655A7|nr:hypothetical protein [Butyrivibrio sp. VCB2006]